jgi:hypothetical protein
VTRRRDRSGRREDLGQATVELALVLPVLVVLAMALVQVGLVARTTVLVHHAAREGARVAAVGGTMREVEDAVIGSSGLLLPDTDVVRIVEGEVVTVTVRHLARTDAPLVGPLLPDVVLSATVSMRRERRGGRRRRRVVRHAGGRRKRGRRGRRVGGGRTARGRDEHDGENESDQGAEGMESVHGGEATARSAKRADQSGSTVSPFPMTTSPPSVTV